MLIIFIVSYELRFSEYSERGKLVFPDIVVLYGVLEIHLFLKLCCINNNITVIIIHVNEANKITQLPYDPRFKDLKNNLLNLKSSSSRDSRLVWNKRFVAGILFLRIHIYVTFNNIH